MTSSARPSRLLRWEGLGNSGGSGLLPTPTIDPATVWGGGRSFCAKTGCFGEHAHTDRAEGLV